MFRPPGNVPDGLNFIKEEIRKGKFKPVIDRKYPLDKIAEAFDYVTTRQKSECGFNYVANKNPRCTDRDQIQN